MKVLVTGSTGFIGLNLCDFLSNNNHDVIKVVRNKSVNNDGFYVKDIDLNTDWNKLLFNVDIVIHLAARVHIMKDRGDDSLDKFRAINTNGTLNFAKQAEISGVKRFIYLSSIKVNGEFSTINYPFTAEDSTNPIDPYAISKYDAEQGLLSIASNSEMEVVIIRPPLVYGPGVKANFFIMMKWLYKGIPLPFGSIYNKRSLISLDNLVDLIFCCIKHPAAKNQIFLVSDNEDLSTSELLKRVSFNLGKKSYLIPINQKFLEFFLSVIGKKNLAQRLCGSLQVDISKTTTLLNWSPPYTVNDELKKTVQYFLNFQSK